MTFDDARDRLITLARRNGGVLTALDAEADGDLDSDRPTASAAAHALAGSTNAFGTPRDDGWFPYEEIRFTELR